MEKHPAIEPGKVAVITGGASGIGLAAARAFGSYGMQIVLADIDEEALHNAVRELRDAGTQAAAIKTDVSSPADLHALLEQSRATGQVSILMNNAAREGGAILAEGHIWDDTLATNLMGPLHGIRSFLPDMLRADWPCAIINTGSKQGITLPPGDTAYNVSKAALKALTEGLAHDLLATNGRITAHLLIPGYTYTGFSQRRGVAEKPDGAWTSSQVADFLISAMAQGDFYILCPDNDVTRQMDERRVAWSAGDLILNRPALSRWHPDYADAFKAHMEN